MKRLFACLAGLICLLAPAAALAQPAPLIIDQSRADRSPPTAMPQAPAPVGSGQVKAAPATVTPFVLKGVRVQGSTLPQAVLAAAWRPYLGKTVTASDLSAVADAVGAVYGKSDVALYTILLPRQSFKDGQARLDVIEGYVADVTVTADPDRPAPRLIRAYGERLTREKPLRRSSLERYVALMRDIPGTTVDVQILQTGKTGAVRLALKAKRRRVEATLGINNRGSSVLGRTQVEASISGNDLLREGDKTTLTVAVPTEVKLFQFVGLAHSEPLGSDGATLNINAGYLHTAPRISGIEIEGHAATASVSVSYPLIRSNTRNLFLTGSLDGVNSDNAVFGEQLSSERTRALRGAAAYSTQSATRSFSLSATLSQGLDGLGARMSGVGVGDASFTKLNTQAAATAVYGRWTVRVSAAAQLAATALPATEVFSLGGAQYGRAFASSVATGQSGYAGSAELAWKPPGLPSRFAAAELYGYIDGGHVQNPFGPLAIGAGSVASTGVGVRVPTVNKTVLELEFGHALTSPPGISGGSRLMVNLRSQF